MDRFGFLRLIYRIPWFLLHILMGTPVAVLCQTAPARAIDLGGRPLSDVMAIWWSSVVCRIFGLSRRVSGWPRPGAQLIAANHISWIDIPLLYSVETMGFVAKAEIGTWPLLGRMAKLGNTVFHQRGSHDSASGALAEIVERLNAGERVAVFPEGGILRGAGVKRFHARMFGAAISTGSPVQPVMLRYSRNGVTYEDITFRPGEHFLANLMRLLAQPGCIAETAFLQPVSTAGKARRQAAEEAEAAVRAAYASELPYA